MGVYWEDATKRIREEMSDPFLWVEFDPDSQEYEIYKKMPGGWESVEFQGVKYHYPTEYAEVQMTFKEWDGRVFQQMRKGSPHNIDVKMRRYEINKKTDYIHKKQEEELMDMGRELGKDLWATEHGKIISHAR